MSETTPRIAIILVHYYTPELLRRCVDALLSDLENSKLQAEILLVDNGERPSEQALIDSLPARVIRPEKNIGFAAAVDQAVSATGAEIFICMHPDVLVLPGCLSKLVDALDHGASAAGPRFFWDRGRTLQRSLGEEHTREGEFVRRLANTGARRWALSRWRRYQRGFWQADRPVVTTGLTDAMIAIRRDAWKAIGGFDKAYQLYFEDADWLMRLSLRQMKAVYVPEAGAIHLGQQSVAAEPAAAQWYRASRDLFNKRYYGARFQKLMQILPERKDQSAARATMLQGIPEIQLPASKQAIWLEISASAPDFPTASRSVLPDEPRTWRLPLDVWKELVVGTYILRVVDADENELACYKFEKARLSIAIFGAYKSATTGLYYKIRNSLPTETQFLFEPKTYTPEARRASLLAKVMIGVPPPSQYETFLGFDKKIYIIRDPRDWMISGLLFIIQEAAAIYTDESKLNRVLQLFKQKETDPRSISVRELVETVTLAANEQTFEMFCEWIGLEFGFLIEFEQKLGQHFLLKSEDFVDRKLDGLEDYLGICLPGEAVVDNAHAHVPRTMGYGDWRNWFTEDDVVCFRPMFEPYMKHFGYGDDWMLPEHPVILPEHSSRYIERTVAKRKAQ